MPYNKSGEKQNAFDSQVTIVTVDLIDTKRAIFPKKNEENTLEMQKTAKKVSSISNHVWVYNVR